MTTEASLLNADRFKIYKDGRADNAHKRLGTPYPRHLKEKRQFSLPKLSYRVSSDTGLNSTSEDSGFIPVPQYTARPLLLLLVCTLCGLVTLTDLLLPSITIGVDRYSLTSLLGCLRLLCRLLW